MTEPRVAFYLDLITQFVAREMPASEFESTYLLEFKRDPTTWSDQVYRILNGLFLDIDAYVEDDALRDAEDLDLAALTASAERAVASLTALCSDD